MNDDHPLSVLDRLDQVTVSPPPLAELEAAGRRARRRQRRAAVVGAVAAVALAAGGATVAVEVVGEGAAEPTSPSVTPSAGLEPTAEELAKATAVARAVIEEQQASVTSASVVVRPGATGASNTGHHCTSSRELQILLIGAFPHAVTGGHVVPPGSPTPDVTVRAMGVTADAETGLACLVGVRTGEQGEIQPAPGATMLPIDTADFAVRIDDGAAAFARPDVRAQWDADRQTLTYVSYAGYSSGCTPTGEATVDDEGVVLLTIEENLGPPGVVCTADAVVVTVTVEGVATVPAGLVVTEHGTTDEVPVETVGLDLFGG